MACPHFQVTIKTKTKSSAVASSAYNSAERLFCENEQVYKDHKRKKEEVFDKGVLLPEHAPPEFADREVLWNSVEMNEKQYNGQLCRSIVAAIPREISKEERVNFVNEFCKDTFVDKGMCCDYSIHDPPGKDNPHVHILLTMRALDEDGKWLPKSRKEYILDENGNKTYYPNGEARSRKVNTTDWDDKGNVEKWRKAWEDKANKYLERCGSKDRLDMRSYERQGKDKLPSDHMGPAATALEKKGIKTKTDDYNRNVNIFNDLLDKISQLFEMFVERFESLKRRPKPHWDPLLPNYLFQYVELNEPERRYLPRNDRIVREIQDLADVYSSLNWLKELNVLTLDDLKGYMEKVEGDNSEQLKKIDSLKDRVDEIDHIIGSRDICNNRKHIYEEYEKKKFDFTRKQFYQEHKKQIDSYIKNKKYLDNHDVGETKNKDKIHLMAMKEELNNEIRRLQKGLDVEGSDSYVKLKKIYDTVSKNSRPEEFIAKSKEEFVETQRVSIHDRLEAGRKRSQEQTRHISGHDTRSLDR